MIPDFKNFRGLGLLLLCHSAKGTTWENHKYIKRIDGTYYYPDSYEGGRHLLSNDEDSNDSNNEEPDFEPEGLIADDVELDNDEKAELSSDDIENLAREVIRGNFGNGQQRKDLLGEYYQEVQNRVNELMKKSTGSKKVSNVKNSKETREGEKAIQKVTRSVKLQRRR